MSMSYRINLGKRFFMAGVGLLGCLMPAVIPESEAAGVGEAPEWAFAMRLYGDEKARRVGDVLTVIIDEQSSINKSAQSESGKQTSNRGSASIRHPVLSTSEGDVETPWTEFSIPEWGLRMQSDFSGGGSVSSAEDFSSTMTAQVMDVLPNGNLLIEGKRTVHLQEEMVKVVLTGIVRYRDVSRDNTVDSAKIADATIRYKTTGPLTNEQRRGLVTRLMNWLNLF